jgi:ankyrin repeat protein
MPVDLGDRRVSRYEASTGRNVSYVVVDVSDDAMHCMQLTPMLEKKLAEGFSPHSGNVMSHIIASKGRSHGLLDRADRTSSPAFGDWLVHSLREGARKCGFVAPATQVILIEHYANQKDAQCACIEFVHSEKLDHMFVRVRMQDGSVVVHDQWIQPEAFLAEDGRFGVADDLRVLSTWRMGDPVPQQWQDLKLQARTAGEIRTDELHPVFQSLVGDGCALDLTAYVRKVLRFHWPIARTDVDCLLTDDQAAARGLQANEKIAYHRRGVYYSNDMVTESSIRQVDWASFSGLFQAEWKASVAKAFRSGDLPFLIQLLQRNDIRQACPDLHQDMCCHVLRTVLSKPQDPWNQAVIEALYTLGVDAQAMLRTAQTYRMNDIECAVARRDLSTLEQTLTGQDLEVVGDQGTRWLSIACAQLDLGSVKHLLKAGARFNEVPIHAVDALVEAIAAGDTELVRLLLKAQVPVLGPNSLGWCPWQVVRQKSQYVAGLGGDLAALREIGESVYRRAAIEALARRPVERQQLELLKAGIDDKAIHRKLTAVIWYMDLEAACSAGDVDEIRRLLASNDVEASKKLGKDSIALLCRLIEAAPVNRSVIQALLDGGVDVNMPLKSGKTPLLAACRHADAATAGLLLGAGARITSSCWKGYSALGHACRTGSLALMRLLLEAGASPIEQDPMGYPPVALAQIFMEACPPGDPTYADRLRLTDELERAAAIRAEGLSQ